MLYTPPLAKLIEEFQKFPGVGPKSAQRMAFFVLGMNNDSVKSFAHALLDAKDKIRHCSHCFYLSAIDPCEICLSQKREKQIICVVAESRDVIALERTGEFKGLYHVLTGLISPMENKGPDQLSIRDFINRVQGEDVKEVILAINPTIEGDTTVLYLSKLLKPFSVKTTRIAFGLPVGSDLEYADDSTLAKALEGRREI
jgi:recombination protein RecR